jgi:UDP-glucose 4-epimerase
MPSATIGQLRGSRVLVTGGAGFIGSHLVDALLQAGSEVLVVDDFSSGSRANLAHHASSGRLRLERADVLDAAAMRSLHKGVQFVFHLATRNVRLSLRQPTVVHEVNATGTLNVLKAASAAGVKRLLYCSSSEVNGTADVVPMREDYRFRPETIYGASKLAGEYYAQVFQRAGWLATVIARPHNNYGPREHYRGALGEVVPRFILWALAGRPLTIFGDGLQTRDFTYVTETAQLMVELMTCERAVGDVFNICRGEEVSIREVARLVAELTGQAVPVRHRPNRPSDVLRLCGDPAKLKRLLGKSPQIAMCDGLARTIAWFRENVKLTDRVLSSMQPENWDGLPPESWLRGASKVASRRARRSAHLR